jgi:putative ABC transport system permease protein
MTPHDFPASERWFRQLLRLYPADFREELGDAMIETYRDRVREAFERHGRMGVATTWSLALIDSFRNGFGERLRPSVVWRRAGDWGRDLDVASRRLRHRPMFFFAMLTTLIVGLGTFAVVYTAVDKVLLEPLPFRDPGDLYMVWAKSPELPHLMVTGPDIAELQNAGGVIEGAAAFQYGSPTVAPRATADAERIEAVISSWNLFDLLGVRPAFGRTFRPEDGRQGATDVAVLSNRYWRRLGADRGLIGQTLQFSGMPFTVIGVLPDGADFAGSSATVNPDIYVPYTVDLASVAPRDSNYRAVARVRRGTSAAQAHQAIDAVGRAIGRRDFHRDDRTLSAIGLHAELVDEERPALLTLAVTGVLLVLALGVNLASLLLARATEREREFAVSRALGGGVVAVVRSTLVEGVILGVLGGIGGTVAGAWGTHLLVGLGPVNLARRNSIAVDDSIAVVVVVIGAGLGLFAAAVPALWASRLSLGSMLSTASVRGAASSGRMRRSLVSLQVALSLVLLTTGALVVRSFERLLAADPGFNPDGVLTFTVGIAGGGLFGNDGNAYEFLDRLDSTVRGLPGVKAVSATSQLPLTGGGNVADISAPGLPEDRRRVASRIFTRAGYIEAMGLRLIQGGGFDPLRREGVREAVIDRRAAAWLFPDRRAVGGTLTSGGQPYIVVGVVEQPRLFDLDKDDETPQLFVRAEDFRGRRPVSYVVRTTGDPNRLIPAVREAVRHLDRRVPISDIRTMRDIIDGKRSQERLSAALLTGLAGGGLLLVTMGLFGVVSGSVARRRGELAVRLALGATHGSVARLVIGDGARLIAFGVLLAVPGIYMAGQTLKGFLVGVSPFDAATLAGVTIGLALVALLACYVAARPVVTIEPQRLLRDA